MRARAYFFAFFALILAIHLGWEILNDTPPIWDMAYHESKGWEYWRAWEGGEFWERFATITPHYPPLYYLQEAAVLGLIRDVEFVPLLANLLGLFLLAYCTFGIASLCLEPALAVWCGLLTLLFPHVAWISRAALLDVPLAGWTAAAGYCLLRSDFLQSRSWTIAFGLSCAAGVLTKWTFPVYVFPLLLYAFVFSQDRKKALLNLVDASIIAIPIVFTWYLPNLEGLLSRYPTTQQTSLIPWQPDPRHGEPGLGSILGWIYYPRIFSSYFLHLPLTVLFVWSAIFSVWNRTEISREVRSLWWWLIGGIVLLIFVTPKDPRFAIPLVPPLAVLLVYPWKERAKWVLGISLLAFLQFLTVSFDTPLHPAKIALFQTEDTDYQSLQREWVLYQTHYFGLAGPPRREDWKLTSILEAVEEGSRVGFVPDLPHLHPGALGLYAIRQDRTVDVVRLGDSADSLRLLTKVDYVLGKTGFQGLSYITGFNDQVYRRLDEEKWPMVGTWTLPDGSQAVLWRRPEW